MAMPMNTADKRVKTYACTSTTIISSTEMPTASGTDTAKPHAEAGDGASEQFREDEDERQNRQDRDVSAGHVRGKSHRERERPHEHAQHFDRDQNHVDHRIQPCGTRFIQCFTNPCALVPATMMAMKVIVASAAVTLKLPVAVVPP